MAAAASKAAPPDAVDAPVAAPRGKKKLMMMAIVGLSLLLLVGGGGAAYYVMKQRAAAAAAAAEEEGEDGTSAKDAKHDAKMAKADLKSAPTFVALDPFTVNLADREAERYAQVGMTLELTDAKSGDLLKAYMPAIRNNILLVLAGKTAAELMDHQGKLLLAAQVRAAALRPLGYEVPDPAAAASAPAKAKKPVADDGDEPPVRAVHFSNFIIQ
ncbi:MAG TPA: flagellar basal body-associated FliL family protein [Burkholderiaceae bacterium]|nr:flagellar basal body-associated FliL family protein [Burkholderiaceae bacterium]